MHFVPRVLVDLLFMLTLLFADTAVENQAHLDMIDVYCQQADTMRFVTRVCLVGLEPGIMDMNNTSPMGAHFEHDNLESAASIDEAISIIRRESESCDCSQGFHSRSVAPRTWTRC